VSPLIVLDVADLAIAAALLLINGGLSLWLQLRLEVRFLVAALRMVAQLLLIGLVLKWLFVAASPVWTGLAALAMIIFAGREALARQDRRFAGWWGYGLGTTAMLMASMLVTVFALTTQLRPDPWFDPRYAIPLLGMVLGNTMTGVSLGLHALSTGAWRDRTAIEARLALGSTRWEAMRGVARSAMTTALMPVINSMAASGLVYLPGMMTGQILSGVAPMEAVKYQILVMFLIAGGTGMGSVVAVMGGVLRPTDQRHRLRLERLDALRA
jgi:putative ABC transport system permease protein